MKFQKRIRAVLLVFFFTELLSSVYAQGQEVTAAKFASVMDGANNFLHREPYRVRNTVETFKGTDLNPIKVRKSVREYIPPFRMHYFAGLEEADKKDRLEQIAIDHVIFTKKGEGEWFNQPPIKGYSYQPKPIYPSLVRFRFTNENLDGKGVIKYEQESTFKDSFGGKEDISTTISTFWFTTDGHLVKIIHESDRNGARFSRITEIYEYDPKIKIEAPIK